MLRSAEGVVVDAATLSDPGRDPEKQTNEDAVALVEAPFGVAAVVCDGMGGHQSGELASRTALEQILETLNGPKQPLERLLAMAIERAHAEVYALGGDNPVDVRPGSTAVVLALAGQEAIIAYVGDSRAYRLRGLNTERLTRDHSVVEALLAAGAITPEVARAHPDANRITRALGIATEIEPEVCAPQRLQLGDVFLLCSDGLSDLVEDNELAEVVASSTSPEAASKALVALANQRGGHDNISVALLRVLSVGPERRETTQEMNAAGTPPTVLDGPQFTVVMPAAESGPRAPATEHDAPRQTVPTLVDPLVAARAPREHLAPVAEPRAPHASSQSRHFSARREGRLLFWTAAFACALILLAMVVWSIMR
ncbi:MAG: PP2C family protein-serine/threonine phosphatase [Myxococcota bacterium]